MLWWCNLVSPVWRHSQQHSQTLDQGKGMNIESYIKVEQEQITRSRVLFHSIRFDLNQDILTKIKQAQETGHGLDISGELLSDLRHLALLDWENRLQSGLTFSTYYLPVDRAQALMRSVIALDGEILHQIKRDCLENPDFCCQIADAHYWLITQILGQLRLKPSPNFPKLAWGLSGLMIILVIVAVLVIPGVLQLILAQPWRWLIIIVGIVSCGLLLVILQWLLRSCLIRIAPWMLRQLLSGLLSAKPGPKKIAKRILAWLLP
ncbi:MAG: hypothetical protein F6K37_28295 [Moorea sp. SIO4E2]|uniref:hypothetical protein n=1 Tax=Moorena sp. SIO4E2 TaxID=2607826 RepID=UPI0013BB957F|nr:hypothetical protein [Moorena sp. SIO4E2]NEQ09704.1 hypothetical protein [Moorena sp. SIO4E2]